MLNNSLFLYYMMEHGLDIYKGESTRSIICLSFDFGSRSYEDEHKRLTKLIDKAIEDGNDDLVERLNKKLDFVEANKEKYAPMARDDIRTKYYKEGVDILWETKNKDGVVKSSQKIHYKMLFRTPAKAKIGSVMFIDDRLYDRAYKWLTMGLGKKMPVHNAKIVEMSAYAPLTTSTIIDRLHIDVDDILFVADVDSFYTTMANIVRAEDYTDSNGETKKMCVVDRKKTDVKNTLFDGQGLIESSILPSYVNGMVLLRNHFFKACFFRTHIQKFFKDWCEENGHDYETYEVTDYFGKKKLLKNIKAITTENAIKWRKFSDLMGRDPYSYWAKAVRKDGCLWGVVKTDHPSKLGDRQQLSYQMLNVLPATKEEINEICRDSVEYVELLKRDNDAFEKFLRKNANDINHYEMMADLYDHNHEFGDSKWFRLEKRKIINSYVGKLRQGKIFVNGDNLTLCGNPYALLLHAVGDDWKKDNALVHEDGTIQCYTKRFNDGEYLCGFRSPNNSMNNVGYFHNVHHPLMEKYFDFSENIIAINCIETDVQSRLNGSDQDSDFLLATNHSVMVECARRCYERFPTIVNALNESGISYDNTPEAYAEMDNKMAKARLGIGWSSNLAMLAISYFFTEMKKDEEERDERLIRQLEDDFIILSVIAQLIIDGCKREYEVSGMDEIKRIGQQDCMHRTIMTFEDGSLKEKKYDFPLFMKYTRPIPYTKNGKELPFSEINKSKRKLRDRVDPSLTCPMNWVEERLDKIQNASTSDSIPTENFFIKIKGKPKYKHVSKIIQLAKEYDDWIIESTKPLYEPENDFKEQLSLKAKYYSDEVAKIRTTNPVTINRLIEYCLGLNLHDNYKTSAYKTANKYSLKIMNLLYKADSTKFLSNFC